MKKFLALFLALVMVLAFAACGEKEETVEEPAVTEEAAETAETAEEAPAAAGRVYWLNFKPESDEALQELATMYTEETGVPVTVVTAAAGTYNETLTAEMDKNEAPTLFVAGNQAAVDTWSDYCYDLTGTPIADELNTDSYMLYDADGKLCSIGYCFECYGIIVNKTLLTEAGYDVAEITNFEALKAAAEDIHARRDELGFDAFASAGMDGGSSWRFTGHLANLEYYYESVDDPDAWTECPATLTGAYMDNYRNLWDLIINNSTAEPTELAAGGLDAEAEFTSGAAVFFPQGNWEWPAIEAAGMTADEVTMIPYYCGVEGEEKAGLNNGTENYWAVNAKASEEDIQATLDFMYWLVTNEAASEKAVATFGAMPYTNAVESSNPFLAISNEYAAKGNYNMWWATNYQPNVDAYRDGLVAALNQYDADQSDANWETVVTAFVQGWATQYEAAYGE